MYTYFYKKVTNNNLKYGAFLQRMYVYPLRNIKSQNEQFFQCAIKTRK